jgi:hypothetical protein
LSDLADELEAEADRMEAGDNQTTSR